MNPVASRTRIAAVCVDIAAIGLACLFVHELASRTGPLFANERRLQLLIVVVVAAHLVIGFVSGLYPGRHPYGSFREAGTLAGTVATWGVGAFVANELIARPARPGVVAAVPVVALLVMDTARWSTRAAWERRCHPVAPAHRVLVFGAGEGGDEVIRRLLHQRDGQYLPVAVLDDDRRKTGWRVQGVPVLGGRESLVNAASATRADMLLVAIPTADRELVRTLAELGHSAGLAVRVLPPLRELLAGVADIRDIRSVTAPELLGRPEKRLDLDVARGYVAGRRVLVTGAGGSIGSELVLQLARLGPAQLVMLDRDESMLHATQLQLEGRALLDDRNLVVADIRDAERLDEVVAEHRPDIIFHTAALKHLPLLEMHPFEAVKTNVWGTQNLLDAAVRHKVSRFVNISTDKAADPTSVLGWSKRLGERLTAAAGAGVDASFVSVRFGNVLGSRGSVLTAFHRQIQDGGPVTVTHPDVTRYFMTVGEAVGLVIEAGFLGRTGEVLILDMGQDVRISDVAQRLVEASGRSIEIVYTGLRPGEKLRESLFGAGETDHRPLHPLISQVPVPPLSKDQLHVLTAVSRPAQLVLALQRMCAQAAVETPEVRYAASVSAVRS